MTAEKKLAQFKQQLAECEQSILLLESERGLALFNREPTDELDKQQDVLFRQRVDITLAITSGEIEVERELAQKKANSIKTRNKTLEKQAQEFLISCEKLESGCISFAGLYDNLIRQASAINAQNPSNKIMLRTLKIDMLKRLAKTISLTAIEVGELEKSLSDGTCLPLDTQYHGLAQTLRIGEVAA